MACNSNKLKFQGKCPFDQGEKKWIFRYFISENLPTFFTLALPYSACPKQWGRKICEFVFEYGALDFKKYW